jgi:hypothetical protein
LFARSFHATESSAAAVCGHSLPKSVDETADKLDAMMDIAFAYIGRCAMRPLSSALWVLNWC